MAQALLTAVGLGLLGLVGTPCSACLAAPTISRHISFGIFSTMLTLLAHSMMMFYLIGKGKGGQGRDGRAQLTGDYYRRIAAARKPVFSIATLAMVVTMVDGDHRRQRRHRRAAADRPRDDRLRRDRLQSSRR